MAAITATTVAATTTTFHLTKFSCLSLSIHRIPFRTLSPHLRNELNNPTFSHKLSFNGFHLFTPSITHENLSLHALSPTRSLHALAEAEAPKKAKKVKVIDTAKTTKTVEQPRYSKAARRFYNENFRENQAQRLAKVLAAAGVASRRSSEELIFQGKVTVNGTVCDTPQTKVDPTRDVIYVNGNRLPKRLPPKLYIAVNKPKGYICSSGPNEIKSVLSLCDDFMKIWDKKNPGQAKPRLFTVGRLDVATTGLIIVTNDGDFAQRVSHPSSNLTKEYIATVDGEVHKRHLLAISNGTMVDGVQCTPESVELLPRQPDILRARIRIVVKEGRNHEVRELVRNAGLEMYALKRTRIGGFRLSTDLGLGKCVQLRENDLKALGWEK